MRPAAAEAEAADARILHVPAPVRVHVPVRAAAEPAVRLRISTKLTLSLNTLRRIKKKNKTNPHKRFIIIKNYTFKCKKAFGGVFY